MTRRSFSTRAASSTLTRRARRSPRPLGTLRYVSPPPCYTPPLTLPFYSPHLSYYRSRPPQKARNILASNTGTFGRQCSRDAEIAPPSSSDSNNNKSSKNDNNNNSELDGALHFGAPRRWQPEWTEALMRQV